MPATRSPRTPSARRTAAPQAAAKPPAPPQTASKAPAARRKAPKAPAPVPATAAAPAPAPKPAKPAKESKAARTRAKPVRDSFTMPPADFALIGTLKALTLAQGRATKKSELLRAGLQALAALDTPALLAALDRLEPVQVGRPRKGR